MCQASSPTKLAKIRAPAVGRSGEATYCWIPRPALYGDAVECSPPRSAVGINEYIYALSQRHPDAVRCANDRPSPPTRESPSRLRLPPAHTASRPSPSRRAGGRRGAAHWELTPSAAGLRVLTIKLRQQYETPAAVVEAVRRAWAPDFDAMATPFSAACVRACCCGRSAGLV